MNVLGGGVLGRWWGHEDGALMNGISVLIKQMPESFGQVRTQPEDCDPQGSRSSPDTKSVGTLILNFPISRIMRNKLLLFISSQSMAFCCSRLKGLWQGSFILLAWKSVHSVAWLVLVEVCRSLPEPWTSALTAIPSLELTGNLLRQQVVTTTPFTCTGC